MSGFGVKTAYGDLKRVIMHRPGAELKKVTDQTLKEFNFTRPVDPERFVSDYDAMLSVFQRHGVETLLLRDILKDDDECTRLYGSSSEHDLYS